jgi:hypothetical protein
MSEVGAVEAEEKGGSSRGSVLDLRYLIFATLGKTMFQRCLEFDLAGGKLKLLILAGRKVVRPERRQIPVHQEDGLYIWVDKSDYEAFNR